MIKTVSLGVFLLIFLGKSYSQESTTRLSNKNPRNWTQIFRNFQEVTTEHDHDHHEHHDHLEEHHEEDISEHEPPGYKTWIFSSLAVLVISLCGVFGVLIIPVMQKIFYQHLLQFLIALAIGTLSGDALLHLLPHAIDPLHDHNDHQVHEEDHEDQAEVKQEDTRTHNRTVWIGLVAATAIIVFYFFEKVVTIAQEWRSRRANKGKVADADSDSPRMRQSPRVVREGHEVSDKVRGESKCIQKYSNYCVADLETDIKPAEKGPDSGWSNEDSQSTNNNTLIKVEVGDSIKDNGDCSKQKHEQEQETVIVSQHEVSHHGHSHAHSHLHSAPRNIASVAWMVILGDGVHNLADGMAIGVAFASGTWSGVSTSIAVLCHELPHEIGDFAMLLKAGMSVKQAIFYNILSSVLSYLGMVLGLVLGQIHDLTPWIFSATAGIFLYVALVDMIPELSSGHTHPIRSEIEHGQVLGLLLQFLGMSLGVGIMLIIALLEEYMMTLLVPDHELMH